MIEHLHGKCAICTTDSRLYATHEPVTGLGIGETVRPICGTCLELKKRELREQKSSVVCDECHKPAGQLYSVVEQMKPNIRGFRIKQVCFECSNLKKFTKQEGNKKPAG